MASKPKRPPNTTVELPSGVLVHFWDEVGVDGEPQQRRYRFGPEWESAEKLVSVSTVANVFDKPALPSWAAKVTVAGLKRLESDRPGCVGRSTVEQLVGALRARGLDHNAVRDEAAKRGDVAHDVLVHALRDGKFPNPRDYPAEYRPWIQAGAAWIVEHKPEVIDAETIVASVEHGFAGRYDLHARFPDGRTGRIDYKSVTEWHYKRHWKTGELTDELLPPYEEHVSQVAGYELAARESGFEPSDFQAVVRLGPDGKFDMTESWASPANFIGDLHAYENRQDQRARGAAARKAAKAEAVDA